MGKREERLSCIRNIIRKNDVRTQAELGRLMADAGYVCTQATISRDIADLGLEKRRGKCYALPEEAQFERLVTSVACAGNMIVVHTLAGTAQGLAAVLDGAELAGILGSVAGDDTIMMVAATPEDAATVTAYIDLHKRG